MSGPIVVDGRSLPWDDQRGRGGMALFIATEAALFVTLFFSYYYLGYDQPRWPMGEPPKLRLALPMLGILLLSSLVLHQGERAQRARRQPRARGAVAATIALGAVFLVLQGLEYHHHLKTLRPTTNAYGSIFYTITSAHAAHLVIGLLMLAYVLLLSRLEPVDRPPHLSLHNASLYWHFVDLVWIMLFTIVYLI